MNITLYRRMLVCPLRSQIKQIKARMFNGVEIKSGKEKGKDQINSMIQSFLHERAVQKLIPERESEIDRISNLIS